MDKKDAEKFKRAVRKLVKTEREFCEAGKDDDVVALAQNYLKARKSYSKLSDKVESA